MKKIYMLGMATLSTFLSNAQRVGIGTATPQAQLEVIGSVRLDTLKGTSLRPVYVNSNGELTSNQRGYIFSNGNSYSLGFGACPQVSSPITVSGLGNAISSSNIQVRVNNASGGLNYSLFVYLQAPNGQLLNLAGSLGGNSGSVLSNATFADNGSGGASGPGTFSGTYKPIGSTSTVGGSCNVTGSISSFAGFGGGSISPNGVWTLIVFNSTPGGGSNGSLGSWSINFENNNFTYQGLTANYVTKTDASGLLSNSLLYDNGTSIGIGTTTPLSSVKLDVIGTVRATSFDNTSDIRLKTGIRPTQYGLKDLLSVQVADYHYADAPGSKLQTGFLAQQLYPIFPAAVTKGNDADATQPYMIDYSKMTPLLVKAVQDLTQEVEQLKATIKRMRLQRHHHH